MKEIYHNLKNYMLTALLVLSSSACGSHGNEQSGTDNSDTPAPSKTSFTQGADISWVSEMEKKGLKFYNHEGIETDCFQLMKELGINAIRLRVWVNPKDRWNSKNEFLSHIFILELSFCCLYIFSSVLPENVIYIGIRC